MANETATPAAAPAVAPAAETPAVQVRKPTGKASDHLAAAVESEKPGGAGGGSTLTEEKKTTTETPEDAEVTSRLSKLAAARQKHNADVAAFRAEQERVATANTEQAKKAASWDKLNEAKGAGKTLEALRELYTQEEIDTKLYNELTADILSREPGDKPLSPAQVDELVQAKLDAAQEAETKRKADEESARSVQARNGFLEHVASTFEASADSYKAIERWKVSGDEVMKHVEDVYAKTGEVPEPKAILDHFEKKLRDEATEVVSPPAAGLPAMVTDAARAGATPTVNGRKLTPKESWEQTKRDLGILPAS